MKKKALVVLSGGMDSNTVLWYAKEQYDEVHAISFNYGSKHNDRELQFAKRNTDFLNIEHKIIPLLFSEWGFRSNLLKEGGDIPEGHYEADSMALTIVPFRNGIMSSIAVGYAESNKIGHVLLGSHKGDNAQYPDCRYEFSQAFNLAVYIGTGYRVKFISPFNDLMKDEVCERGLELGVHYHNTWSCYRGQERPCLKCGTCVERTEAFYLNKTKDPLLTDEEWGIGVEYWKKVKQEHEKEI